MADRPMREPSGKVWHTLRCRASYLAGEVPYVEVGPKTGSRIFRSPPRKAFNMAHELMTATFVADILSSDRSSADRPDWNEANLRRSFKNSLRLSPELYTSVQSTSLRQLEHEHELAAHNYR